jgi:hypothetical protein
MRLFTLAVVLCASLVNVAQAADQPPSCDVCWQGQWATSSTDGSHYFTATAGYRYDILLFRESASGNVDLYTDDSSGVSTTQYDCRSILSDGSMTDQCSITPGSTRTQYVAVHSTTGSVQYGLYIVESDAGCHTGNPGDASYCTTSCTCGWEFADCDSNAECAPGLTCVADVGADYGWPSTIDVCRGG